MINFRIGLHLRVEGQHALTRNDIPLLGFSPRGFLVAHFLQIVAETLIVQPVKLGDDPIDEGTLDDVQPIRVPVWYFTWEISRRPLQ